MNRQFAILQSTRAIALAALVLCAGASSVARAQASSSSGGYTLSFQGAQYDFPNNTATWTYQLEWNGVPPALSHFDIELCTEVIIVDAYPTPYFVGVDGATGLFAIKWESSAINLPQTFSFTTQGTHAVGAVDWIAKAGTNANVNSVDGPSLTCETVECDGDAMCDDGNVCNGQEVCSAEGHCVPGPEPTCDDADACTADRCDPAIGCVHDDDSMRCNDENACTADSCDPLAGCLNVDISSECNDGNACTADVCEPAIGCVAVDISETCGDENVCTADSCHPELGCINEDISTTCADGNACTSDSCDPLLGCMHQDDSARCEDDDVCTANSCDPEFGCISEDVSARCEDGNACTADSCHPELGCQNEDISATCDDGNACTADSCDPSVGCVNEDISSSCDDGNACTNDSCDPVAGCVSDDVSDLCDDFDVCTNDGCDPVGGCYSEFDVSNSAICEAFTCRTPGFWGTHAGEEKRRSINVTQSVLDYAGGAVDVCGYSIDSTDIRNGTSAVEAMCVSPEGDQTLQLIRQLTALSLNCIVSGGDSDCSGTLWADLRSECNDACGQDEATVSHCIEAVDCINNGGNWMGDHCIMGTCSDDGQPCKTGGDCIEGTCELFEHSCQLQDLLLDADGDGEYELDFSPPGPAGSTRACDRALRNECVVPDCN